jgi:hypothetical protein
MDANNLNEVAVPPGCKPVRRIAIRDSETFEIVATVPVQSADVRLCVVIAHNLEQSLREGFFVDFVGG